MNLFSVFRSSAIEIMLSKRLMLITYGMMAIAILSHMVAAYGQFFTAYVTLHEFDISVGGFVAISALLFLPFWVLGALLLRACVQRIRLGAWVRTAIKTANYDTLLSPAEAGFLTDYDYSHRELAATLLHLHFRKIISISIGTTIKITVLQNPSYDLQLSPHERTLLSSLVSSGDNDFNSFMDERLAQITLPAHNVLIDSLTARGLIRPERLPAPIVRKFFRVLYIIAGAVGAINLYAIIFLTQTTLSIGYPRYPVSLGEIYTLVILTAIVLSIVASSYWPRFTQNYKDKKYQAWMDAAGFMLYLRSVYTDRFSAETIQTQDISTIKKYTPYAVADGIIPATNARIRQIIELTSGETYR